MAGGKGKQRRKVWFELYWPDSTKPSNARKVGDPQAGKKLYKLLKMFQEIYEQTGVENSMLRGSGTLSTPAKK